MDVDVAVVDFYREGLQVDANRGAQCLAGAHVETTLVQGALDDVVDDDTVGEWLFFMGTHAIARKEAIDRVEYRVLVTIVVVRHHILFIEFVCRADPVPVGASFPGA